MQDWLTLWEDKSHDFLRGFVGGIASAEDIMVRISWQRRERIILSKAIVQDKLWKRRSKLLDDASPNSGVQSEEEYAVPDSESSI